MNENAFCSGVSSNSGWHAIKQHGKCLKGFIVTFWLWKLELHGINVWQMA